MASVRSCPANGPPLSLGADADCNRPAVVKVDEGTSRYYMHFTMRLLLVLSAFLTAMVGLGDAAPAAARPACEVSVSVAAKVERFAPVSVAIAAPQKSSLDRASFAAISRTEAPAATVPLYADRLRV